MDSELSIDSMSACRMPTSSRRAAQLPARPLLNPAVPIVPLPDDSIQVGWSPRQRLFGAESANVVASLPLLKQQRPLKSYDTQQRQGLEALLRCGALQSGRWPRSWARTKDADRARLRGLVNSIAHIKAADIVAARSRHSIWIKATGESDAFAQGFRQLGLAVATNPSAASLAALVGPTGFQQISSLMRNGMPHVAISPRTQSVRIGPLVIPGRSPCLQCLHLTRTDRDRHFPLLSLRLERWADVERDPVLVQQAALATARLVSQTIDAFETAPRQTKNEIELPTRLSQLTSKYWTVSTDGLDVGVTHIARHPRCPCWWQSLAATG